MRWIADMAYAAAGIGYLPVLGYQALMQGKNRHGWGERFGRVRLRPAGTRRVWIHAVSLGEVNATRGLVERLETRFPDREIVVSTTTDTGHARACALYGAERVFRFPLDFSWVVERVLDRVGPELIVLMELEVWYNLVRTAARRGVPVAVVNGRMTEHSFRRLGRLGPVSRSMFGALSWVGAQDETIASRFRDLGTAAEAVRVTGSMKWDTAAVADGVDGVAELATAMGIDRSRPLWVCGSTGPGEEAVILDAYGALLADGQDVALAIVPRKPERFDEVARLIEKRSFGCVRRTARMEATSQNPPQSPLVKGGSDSCVSSVVEGRSDAPVSPLTKGGLRGVCEVFLGDTIGELRKFYALATVVFIGRSLVPMGGSDPMEVAAIGRPMLAGPHMENFAVAVDALRARDVLRMVSTADDLADQVRGWIANEAEARRAGETARQVVLDHQGATDVTVEELARLMEPACAAPA